ncbi:MAG: T9SS type A sorting domain-containing protein [Bacteroidales bacterium]|nr:T9SS type A sorting domain-containing protein [Bacteroidales bacterium]
MNRKFIASLLYILFVLFPFNIMAQEKPPIAVTDTVRTIGGYPVTVNVLENDIHMADHEVKVFNVMSSTHCEVIRNDSFVTLIPPPRNINPIEVYYTVIDNGNGLLSEPGHILMLSDSIEYNIIHPNSYKTLLNPFGTQFWNISTTYPFLNTTEFSLFEVNGNPNRTLCDKSSLWIAGKDEQGNLHVSAERYRIGPALFHFSTPYGADFFLGPVHSEINDTIYNHQIPWNRMWAITRDEIEYLKDHYNEPSYEIPEAIASWPGNGDANAGQSPLLAPFYDHNQNEQYDPEMGDYPEILGDSCFFFIFNDDAYEHTETEGIPLGIEIHGMTYAFNTPADSSLHHSLFFRYIIINRSDTNYHDVYLGNWSAIFSGIRDDDYLGCDTSLNAFFAYNADEHDGENTITIFGDHPPAIGIKFLNHSLDHFLYHYYFNFYDMPDSIDMYEPRYPAEYYMNLQGKWLDNTSITHGGIGAGGNTPVNHAFPGDLHNPDEWSELSAGNEPQTKFSLGSTGPFDLPAGDTLTLDFAIVYARDYEGDHISSVDLLKERMATIQTFYDKDSVPGGSFTGIEEKPRPAETHQLKVYPNPATSQLYIEYGKEASYAVYNLHGKKVLSGSIQSGKNSIKLKRLSKGLYLITLNTEKQRNSMKFIKQ